MARAKDYFPPSHFISKEMEAQKDESHSANSNYRFRPSSWWAPNPGQGKQMELLWKDSSASAPALLRQKAEHLPIEKKAVLLGVGGGEVSISPKANSLPASQAERSKLPRKMKESS